ncbi:MAG: hypothetical protein JO272_04735 [Pseudonocardiales bacterium]|nr:hypothetical protein [Pseudonocardiales bacterium]
MTLLLPAGFAAPTELSAIAGVQAPPPKPGPAPSGHGVEFGKAAPAGLVVLLLLLVTVALLVRSMNKHLRRLPESFEDDSAPGPRAE